MNPRVLIADDEPLLREELARLLTSYWPQVELVAQTANGEETRHALRELQPDVAFLDIRMPPPDGLTLAEEFESASVHVVFVTAYDEFAVQAFDKNACDYLLKPVSASRFQATVARLQDRIRNGETMSAIATLRSEINALKAPTWLERVAVRRQGATRLINVSEIRYFKSDAKYTLAYDAEHEYILSTPLKELERQLDPALFWRIHRNCLVNVNQIEQISRAATDNMQIKVKSRSESLRVSRRFRQLFHEL